MNDDGFHEIQLNGKQLVFMFMLATVVLVATFLSGVLVGRGVPVEKGEPAADLATTPDAAAPDAGSPGAVASSGAVGAEAAEESSPRRGGPSRPPPEPETLQRPEGAQETGLSYHQRLEGQPPPETLKPSSATAPATTDRSQATKLAPPAGEGFAVQIAALRERSEAEAIVRRLTEKGYPAYMMEPPEGAPAPVYRIRVGKFRDRREAEAAAGRLEKEEQFKPWIIR